MKGRYAGWVLLGVQLALVLSIAGKYWYERATRPAVWVRTGQYDPEMPLRGRYLALQLTVDACGLPRNTADLQPSWNPNPNAKVIKHWQWPVSLKAQDGNLVGVLNQDGRNASELAQIDYWENVPCDRAHLDGSVEFFIPEHAHTPFPLESGRELWVLVTVPESGPPRPIELAISDAGGWHPLRFE
jgi:hypothetical protein